MQAFQGVIIIEIDLNVADLPFIEIAFFADLYGGCKCIETIEQEIKLLSIFQAVHALTDQTVLLASVF